MELAAELGARSAEASPERIGTLCSLGREIGLCLQMLDDLSGVTSERRRHKGREDLLASRPSWVWAWLAQATDRLTFQRLRGKAEAVARGEHDPNELVVLFAERIGDLGRRAVKARLAGALSLARTAFGDARGLLELETELVRLRRFDG
jgi:geranylgeranyl pyrophosphate synthase